MVDTGSLHLNEILILGVKKIFLETPCIVDNESCRLCVSLIRKVTDFAYRLYCELSTRPIVDVES
jgi:hypothetical protein